RIGPTARLCADAECWTGDGRRLKPPMAHRQNHCRSGPCPRIGSKEKAPANSHLHGLLNKWSEPLSPGCSEESSWTVTVHGRTGLRPKEKAPANSHLQGLLDVKGVSR